MPNGLRDFLLAAVAWLSYTFILDAFGRPPGLILLGQIIMVVAGYLYWKAWKQRKEQK